MLKSKEMLPHPANDFHLAVVSPVKEFKDLHLTFQVVIDYWKRNLPFTDLTSW
jgi:hypothetical protein